METTINKTKWALDTTHSEVQFKVKHLVISTTTGTFKIFGGELETEGDNMEDANIQFTIDAGSIDTNSEQRDEHLKSADFFDSANHPKLTFVSTSFKKKSEEEYILKGNLTIRDVTKPIELVVEYGGTIIDPWGQTKAGFEVSGKINRTEYGLVWNALTEAGGMVVSEDVRLHINVEFSKQA